MAIHKTVFYSPDRRIRITADPGGSVFTIERDLVFYKRAPSLAELALVLAEFNLTFEDLIED
jgi:hypothetical protein